MLIRNPRGWELPESRVTPEHIFLSRRQVLAGAGAIGGAALIGPGRARAQETVPTADLYPAAPNEAFKVERPITDEGITGTYNNFYEFGSHKQIYRAAQALKVRPWEVRIDGLVDKPMTIGIDDLVRQMGLEERVVRHRCVEAWSMVVPWTGFPLAKLLAMAAPQAGAKYLRMETFQDPSVAGGQKQVWYPWPYVEGLTMAEAGNELAFLVTGAYGKPLANQFGAPLRLHLPWKYGFKSIKSIVRFEFVADRPKSFWEAIAADEYGFWANVSPDVPHARWSQAQERDIGTGETIPTRIFNGYGEWVAGLYAGMEAEKLYM